MSQHPQLHSDTLKLKLLDQVRYALRTKHYSLRSEESYGSWIKRFIFFHKKRHLREMGEAEVNQFLTYLAVQKKCGGRNAEPGALRHCFSLRASTENRIWRARADHEGKVNWRQMGQKKARMEITL